MRPLALVCTLALLSFPSVAQWTITSAPLTARKDDIFFIGADTGWAACGDDGAIIRTYDSGATWQTVHFGSSYLRSIEFATPLVGFCGSLDGGFLKTTDGGDTWADISNLMPPPVWVCGLCAPTPEVIYGVGVYFSPAYLVRSQDGGDTWEKIDLSTQASGLVDVYFLNADTGFIAGRALQPAMDGIILATTDGGDTWTERHHSGTTFDYVWKLQSPDGGNHLYGSVEAAFGPTRIVRSADRGATWETDTIWQGFIYSQVIGFIDTLHGWVGANELLETQDGGETWNVINLGSGYDRFHKVNDSLAFMSGNGVYKYQDFTTGVPTDPGAGAGANPTVVARESVHVHPNPAGDAMRVRVELLHRSRAEVVLSSGDGRTVRTLYTGMLEAGEHIFPVDLTDLLPGTYHALLRTNQGLATTTFVRL